MSDAGNAMGKLQLSLDEANLRRLVQKMFDNWLRLEVVESIQKAHRKDFVSMIDAHEEKMLHVDKKVLRLADFRCQWIAKMGQLRVQELDEVMFFTRWRQLTDKAKEEVIMQRHSQEIYTVREEHELEANILKSSRKVTRLKLGENYSGTIDFFGRTLALPMVLWWLEAGGGIAKEENSA
jgi:hypothetical protein